MFTLNANLSKEIILIFKSIFFVSNNIVSFGLLTCMYFAKISLIELLIIEIFCGSF